MNTFFRICVYICLGLILFTLAINLVVSTGAFPVSGTSGPNITSTNSSLSVLTGLDDPSINTIWLTVTTLGGIAAIGLVWISHSIVPIGLYLFSTVFWTSYIRAWSVIGYGQFLSDIPEFMLLFTVAILFVFIAAIVGILTGGG